MLWKVPALGEDRRLGIYVRLPAGTKQLSEPRGFFAEGAYIQRWRIQRLGGFDGQIIEIDGLSATRTDVFVRLEHTDCVTQTVRLLPSAPSFTVEATPSDWQVAMTYLWLGVEHILLGVDHLLFVLALMLLVKG